MSAPAEVSTRTKFGIQARKTVSFANGASTALSATFDSPTDSATENPLYEITVKIPVAGNQDFTVKVANLIDMGTGTPEEAQLVKASDFPVAKGEINSIVVVGFLPGVQGKITLTPAGALAAAIDTTVEVREL